MIDYSKSRIYQLIDLTNNNIYIGSTTRKLSQRLGGHVASFNCYKNGKQQRFITSFEIIKNGNYRIELIESYPCNNKEQLFAREGYWIKRKECINKQIAGRTFKEWYIDNKEQVSEYNKLYYLNNIEKVKQHQNKKNICQCSGKYTNRNKAAHLKSKKHLKYIEL